MSSSSVTCKANCLLIGTSNNVIGNLVLVQTGNTVQITGSLSLPHGQHGLQICQYGDLNDNFASCGSIFNPFGKTHGAPTDSNRMVGDLGNVVSDENKKSTVNITDTTITLVGPHSILGRSIVVYAGQDDMGRGGHDNSNTTGNPGPRLGAGVIGIAATS